MVINCIDFLEIFFYHLCCSSGDFSYKRQMAICFRSQKQITYGIVGAGAIWVFLFLCSFPGSKIISCSVSTERSFER